MASGLAYEKTLKDNPKRVEEIWGIYVNKDAVV